MNLARVKSQCTLVSPLHLLLSPIACKESPDSDRPCQQQRPAAAIPVFDFYTCMPKESVPQHYDGYLL